MGASHISFVSLAVSQFRGSILRSAYLKCNYVTKPREACPNSKCAPNAPHKCLLLLPVPGGHTATILHRHIKIYKDIHIKIPIFI